MQTIYLDISNKGVVPTVYAKQGDVGRKFEVVLTDSGLPYVPTNGSAFSVWYSGASGEGNYTNIGDKSAFSVNENKVTVEMIAQMLSNNGDGVLSLVLNNPNGNQIASWNIPYICEFIPGADSEEAKDYYTAFSNAVQNLPYPDASLSTRGKAADAAAVGAALAGKAPAGYGLGTQAATVNNPDDALQSGFYRCPVISELGTGGYMSGWVVHNENGWISQYWNYFGSRVRREIEAGVWQPYEWLNPRLSPGVEYRTTERWQGKAVYTMLVNVGTTSNGTQTIAHSISATKVIRCTGMFPNAAHGTLPYDDGTNKMHIHADKTNFTLTANLAGIQIYATIWYTKD